MVEPIGTEAKIKWSNVLDTGQGVSHPIGQYDYISADHNVYLHHQQQLVSDGQLWSVISV